VQHGLPLPAISGDFFEASMPPAFHWHCAPLASLSVVELHQLYAARQAVFVVEQSCAYQDADAYDLQAQHLCAWAAPSAAELPELLAYLRILPPGIKYSEAAWGRVLTTQAGRGQGLGKALLAAALTHTQRLYGNTAIRISAQQHLEAFYQAIGFQTVSAVYLEDAIPHVAMLRPPDSLLDQTAKFCGSMDK
jgi:ElaA protein